MKTTINLFDQLKATPSSGSTLRISRRFLYILLAALVVVVIFGFYLGQVLSGSSMDAQMQAINEYLNDSSNQQAYTEATVKQETLAQLHAHNQAVQTTQNILKGQLQFGSEIFSLISANKPASVSFESLAFKDRTISIVCRTSEEIPPANYAETLTRSGSFESVIYEGFSKASDSGYIFTLSCILAQGGNAQ